MTPSNQDGEARKLSSHELLEARREKVIRDARRVLLTLLLEHGSATIDDVRDVIELPKGIDPKCFGVVPGQLARAGIIRRVCYMPSTRAVAHARPVSVWRLADAHKAQAWLKSPHSLPPVGIDSQKLLAKPNETGGDANATR